MKGHVLDFDNYPVPVKSYDYLKTFDIRDRHLPQDIPLDSLFSSGSVRPSGVVPDSKTLSSILFLAYGVTRSARFRGIDFFSRTVPSAGGLYPCHLYLVVQGMVGLETGVYYCDMIHQVAGLIHKTEKSMDSGPCVSFIITAEFYISAWKYRQRAFRYMLLDAGHLLENLSLAIKSFGIEGHILTDIDDNAVTRMLCLDTDVEVPLAMVTVGGVGGLPKLIRKPAKVLSSRPDLPAMGVLRSVAALGRDRVLKKGAPYADGNTEEKTKPISIQALTGQKPVPLIPYSQAALQRVSKRKYSGTLLEQHLFSQLVGIASSLKQSGQNDRENDDIGLQIGMTCENVEGVSDGFYYLTADGRGIYLVNSGQFHRSLAGVCLDQVWMSKAAVQFLFMADIKNLEKTRGAAGYRSVFMAAARIAHRMYLGATALGLGCCAVGALYDHEAQDLFDLDDETALFYVVSTGVTKH